jgi:hypothetical protein
MSTLWCRAMRHVFISHSKVVACVSTVDTKSCTSCRSIGDIYAFVRQLTVRQPGVSRNASHLTGRCLASRSDATTVPLYRLVNRSGLRVSYWARSAATLMLLQALQQQLLAGQAYRDCI